MSPKVLLLLGAGSNIGLATIHKFKSLSYSVAAVSRNPTPAIHASADLVLSADFSDPSALSHVFTSVESALGVPTLVIYNAYSWHPAPDPTHILSTPLADFAADLNVITISFFAAAQEAVSRWLAHDIKGVFLFTGNRGNTAICPYIMSLGLTKAASWYLVQTLAAAYGEKGLRFYFVDERTPEGKGMQWISGSGHAEFFAELAGREGQGEVLATFVKGRGYVGFPGEEGLTLKVMGMEELADLEYGKEEREGVE